MSIYSKLRRSSFTLFTGVLFSSALFAKEGMRIPPKVVQSQADILASGLGIPVEQLYNTDGTGLNNAVVLFGRGCTGEMISGSGLLITNHHCAYGTAQGLASTKSDYFANGFWAMNQKEELPCPGLTVTYIKELEEVTANILNKIADTLSDVERNTIIKVRIENLEKAYRLIKKKDVSIKSFANGNQYWAIISDTYKDVRMVAFPPNGIGQFGGDTDNWSWPRHTGDFSMFRVYSNEKGEPVDYHVDNVPYKNPTFFTINANGYQEGDFTMVYGFPGVTQEYVSSMQLAQVVDILDPIRIDVRTKKLNVWKQHMNADRAVFLKYTSKKASVANGWKKWQGEVLGLKLNQAVTKKEEQEKQFQVWANSNADAPAYANDLLTRMQVNFASNEQAVKANEYIREALFGIELVSQAALLEKMQKLASTGASSTILNDSITKWSKGMTGFFKNYDMATDQEVFENLMPIFINQAGNFVPEYYVTELQRFGGDYKKWAKYIYSNSIITSSEKWEKWLSQINLTKLQQDPALLLFTHIQKIRTSKINPIIDAYNTKLNYYNRLFTKALTLQNKNKDFYPDANGTLRIAYGKVAGITPDGSKEYSYQTNLDGAVLKHDASVAEFDMPEKLRKLHEDKDYGCWGVNGTVPLAFIADNHTSGGNSGSPVLNAKGHLIGTNFDRIWEGTMSDYYFDPKRCRNISVDIRYTLFILEKFGGAGWLLNEMKFAPATDNEHQKIKTKK
jgi:hypothetical protein